MELSWQVGKQESKGNRWTLAQGNSVVKVRIKLSSQRMGCVPDRRNEISNERNEPSKQQTQNETSATETVIDAPQTETSQYENGAAESQIDTGQAQNLPKQSKSGASMTGAKNQTHKSKNETREGKNRTGNNKPLTSALQGSRSDGSPGVTESNQSVED